MNHKRVAEWMRELLAVFAEQGWTMGKGRNRSIFLATAEVTVDGRGLLGIVEICSDRTLRCSIRGVLCGQADGGTRRFLRSAQEYLSANTPCTMIYAFPRSVILSHIPIKAKDTRDAGLLLLQFRVCLGIVASLGEHLQQLVSLADASIKNHARLRDVGCEERVCTPKDMMTLLTHSGTLH